MEKRAGMPSYELGQQPSSLVEYFAEKVLTNPETAKVVMKYQPLIATVSGLDETTVDEQLSLFVHFLWIANPNLPEKFGIETSQRNKHIKKFHDTTNKSEEQRYENLFTCLENTINSTRPFLTRKLSN